MIETRSMKRKEKQKDSPSDNASKRTKSKPSSEQVATEADQNKNATSNGMNPLLMEDILSHLFKFLDLESSKNSRLVCKLWNKEINKIFFRNRVIQVPEKFHAKFGSKEEEKNAELDELKEFFSSVGKIQALKFRRHRDAQCFIRLNFPWGKIDTIISTIGQDEMKKEINARAFDELLKVALCVKKVELPSPSPFHGSWMKLVDIILSAAERREQEGKFNHPILLSGLNLGISTREGLNKIQELCNASLFQLERVRISPCFNIENSPGIQLEVTEMLEKVMETNKNVLVQLLISNYSSNVRPGFKIPVMSQLEVFKLVCNSYLEQRQFGFDPHFQFYRNMPNLKIVKLIVGYGRTGRSILNNLLLNIQPAPSVKYLELKWTLDLVPDKIFETFPGIESLNMIGHSWMDLAHVGQCCPELKTLIQYLVESEEDSKLWIARMSGFSLDTVEKCLNSVGIENIEGLRVNSSLLNLPALEHFIFFDGIRETRVVEKHFSLLQNLILNRMPNVKITHFDWTKQRVENCFGP